MKSKHIRIVLATIVVIVLSIIVYLIGYSVGQIENFELRSGGMALLYILLALLLMSFIFLSAYVIIEKRQSNKRLLEADQMYVNLISNMQGGVITCIFDIKTSNTRTIYLNDGWTEITGYTIDELNSDMGGNPQSLILPEDRISADKHYIEQTKNNNNYKLQYRVRKKDGDIIWVIDKGMVTVQKDGNIQNQSIITEVTDIKENEEQLRRLAQMDPLTRLCNKVETASAVQRVLSAKKENLHALMVLDIDDFKSINDSLGHIFGDTVLIEVSNRLNCLFRSMDIIGRIGGDEFLIFMKDISSRAVVEKKANEVCESFRDTFIGERGQYKISCSLGIVLSSDGEDYQDLFYKADMALYEAKDKGKDQYIIYNSDK